MWPFFRRKMTSKDHSQVHCQVISSPYSVTGSTQMFMTPKRPIPRFRPLSENGTSILESCSLVGRPVHTFWFLNIFAFCANSVYFVFFPPVTLLFCSSLFFFVRYFSFLFVTLLILFVTLLFCSLLCFFVRYFAFLFVTFLFCSSLC